MTGGAGVGGISCGAAVARLNDAMIEHEAPFKKFPPTVARLESIEITPKSHDIPFTRAVTVQSAGGDNVALADGV